MGTGRHLLGPHVVGSRVVVRRVVRGEVGPSGGPALTDVLGECVAWGDGVCVVRPEHGAAVTIALGDIVSGKPVPPRASVRDRVPAVEAQRHAFALFPDLVTAPVGDWVLRDSATATARRAHSVLAFGPSGVPDDVERVVAHYDRPVAAVLSGSAEHDRLRGLGWVPESNDGDTLFQVAGVAQVARALRGSVPDDVVLEPPAGRAAGLGARPDRRRRDRVRRLRRRLGRSRRPRGRRRPRAGAAWAWRWWRRCSTGARSRARRRPTCRCSTTTQPALALYERLGFRTHHRYRYLAAPRSRSERAASHGHDVRTTSRVSDAGDEHADDVDAELSRRTRRSRRRRATARPRARLPAAGTVVTLMNDAHHDRGPLDGQGERTGAPGEQRHHAPTRCRGAR